MTGRDPTVDERKALARLAEILEKEDMPLLPDMNWLNRQFSLPESDPLEFETGSPWSAMRDRDYLFTLFLDAHRKEVFPHWFGDLMQLYIGKVAGLSLENRIFQGLDKWEQGKKVIRVLGYELAKGKNQFEEETVVLLPISGGPERQEQLGKLRANLYSKHPSAGNALQGAYEAYQRGGSDARRQACDSARNALENVVRDLTGKGLGPGIEELCQDDKRRKKLFKTLRDFVGVEGTHADTQPNEEDMLLAIRMVEDTLIWLLQRAGEW